MIKILFPDSREVSEETVIGWAQDEWNDNPVGDKPETLEECIAVLEDAGVVTFQKI